MATKQGQEAQFQGCQNLHPSPVDGHSLSRGGGEDDDKEEGFEDKEEEKKGRMVIRRRSRRLNEDG